MHEASIVLNILDTIQKQCAQEGYKQINSVRLRIGKAAQILPDALLFAFDAAKQGTIANEAEMIIDMIPLSGKCNACSQRFEVKERFIFNCPACASTGIKIDRGYEMEIVDMEVD